MQMRQHDSNDLNDLSNPDNRPARLFLETIKSLFTETEAILNQHTFRFNSAIKKNKMLKQAFEDIESMIISDEYQRPEFQVNNQLLEDLNTARTAVSLANRNIRRIENGKQLAYWKRQAIQLSNAIKQTELNDLNKHNINIIEQFKTLRNADTKLHQLENEESTLTGCINSKKRSILQERIDQQMRVVNSLELSLDQNEPSAELSSLRIKLNAVQQNVARLTNDLPSALSEANKHLESTNTRLNQIIAKANLSQTRHYGNLNTTIMHGILRLYTLFHAYMIEFEHALNEKIPNKDKATSYMQLLTIAKQALDNQMGLMWCEQYGHCSANEILRQFSTLPQAAKNDLLKSKPDETAFVRMMGNPSESNLKTNIEKTGFFGSHQKQTAQATLSKREMYKQHHTNLDRVRLG